MKHYEYRIERISDADANLEQRLNEIGAAGFRIAHVDAAKSDGMPYSFQFIFEREIEEITCAH